MDKIKVGEKEYTEEELATLVSQGEDYTTKTQKLAEDRQLMDSQSKRLQQLADIDEYCTKHPDVRESINKYVEKDIEKRYGVRPDGTQVPPQRNYTNVGQSDYTPAGPGADMYNDEEEVPKAGMSREEITAMLDERDRRRDANQTNKEVQTEIMRQDDQLKKMGYTEEERKKVVAFGQQKRMWPLDAAQSLAFNKSLPDRFHEEPKNDDPPPVNILKGQPGSGFDIPEPEKELIKFGGDPGEMLRAKAKNLILEE